jgi:hypothetical protein
MPGIIAAAAAPAHRGRVQQADQTPGQGPRQPAASAMGAVRRIVAGKRYASCLGESIQRAKEPAAQTCPKVPDLPGSPLIVTTTAANLNHV